MKEDLAIADREINNLKNLHDTVFQEKNRLQEIIKRLNKKARS